MKTLLAPLNRRFGRLWVKLALCFTLISIVSEVLLLGIMDVTVNWRNFQKATEPQYVLSVMQPKLTTLIQTMALPAAAGEMSKELAGLGMALHDSDSEYYNINKSCRPLVTVAIYDERLNVLAQASNAPDAKAISRLSAFNHGNASASRSRDNVITLTVPVQLNGRVVDIHCELIARFDILLQLKNSVLWLRDAFEMFVLFSSIMGLAGGAFAARLVTRRLSHMTTVSSAWSAGDWDARITDTAADELSEHARQLNQMAAQLKELIGLRLVKAVQDERTRMAAELHDRVKQRLFALSLQLAATANKIALPDEATKHLQEAREILSESQRELVGMIEERRQEIPLKFGLAVKQLCDEYARQYGVKLIYRSSGDELIRENEKTPLLQIVLESVHNALRHACPKEIKVTLAMNPSQNKITIRDDGIGFDVDASAKGLGLALMRERAEKLTGGKLSIESQRDRGTQVTLTWTNSSV